MNRRSLFKALAIAPIAMVTAPAEPAAPYPVGFIRDVYVAVTDCYDSHSPYSAIPRREIWDGQRFVDFNEPEGAAVLTKLLTRIA